MQKALKINFLKADLWLFRISADADFADKAGAPGYGDLPVTIMQ